MKIDTRAPPLVDELELDLLLEAVYRIRGQDFRDYARASLHRRVWKRVVEEGVTSISGLQDKVLRDDLSMARLLMDLSVNVTAMFRDPDFYLTFRKKIVPSLRTYPFIRVWNAGCSTGEEAYSFAILLAEEGLYDRSRIYATDSNEAAIQTARSGTFALAKMRQYTNNYIRSGGRRAFSEYYAADGASATLDPSLRANIVFAQHDLVSDRSFNDFHVIVCRNVSIYFSRSLQEKVQELFNDSLVPLGVLALGRKESIRFSRYSNQYEGIDEEQRLYKKMT